MFFNLDDIIRYNDKSHLILSIEDEDLILLDIEYGGFFAVPKDQCTKINSITCLRTRALKQRSDGTLTTIVAEKKLIDVLYAFEYLGDNLSTLTNTQTLVELISKMEQNKSLNKDSVDKFYTSLSNLKDGSKMTGDITGIADDCKLVIRITLSKHNGKVGITNVKRIFGDDGIFGNIKKSDTDRKTNHTRNNSKQANASHHKNLSTSFH